LISKSFPIRFLKNFGFGGAPPPPPPLSPDTTSLTSSKHIFAVFSGIEFEKLLFVYLFPKISFKLTIF